MLDPVLKIEIKTEWKWVREVGGELGGGGGVRVCVRERAWGGGSFGGGGVCPTPQDFLSGFGHAVLNLLSRVLLNNSSTLSDEINS